MENSEFLIKQTYVKKIFNDNKSYIVPSYQRAYVWGKDEITELLDDLEDFFIQSYKGPDQSINDYYFIGSILLCSIESKSSKYYILDGQQRLTTILIIWLSLIDLIVKTGLDKDDQYNFDEALDENKLAYINEKMGAMKSNTRKRCRITFETRIEVNDVLLKLIHYAQKGQIEEFLSDIDVKNLTKIEPTVKSIYHGVKYIQAYIKQNKENYKDNSIYNDPVKLYEFMFTLLWEKISFAEIDANSLNDAYKLFTVINNRGVKLSNSDIIKTINLQAISSDGDDEKVKLYAKKWEEIEKYFSRPECKATKLNLDLFLELIKTIYVKESGQKSLYAWYEEDIFKIKNRDKSKPLVNVGKEFIDKMVKFFNIYKTYIDLENNQSQGKDVEYQNTIKIMNKYINDNIWKSAVLMFVDKFEDEINESKEDLKTEFIKRLENYYTFFWITLQTRTQAFTQLAKILKLIERSNSVREVLESELWYKEYSSKELKESLQGNIYKLKYRSYILFRYEKILCGNKSITESGDKVTIEHILPQKMEGEWKEYFSSVEHEEYLHKIGNLTILDLKDNSKLSNNNIEEKISFIEKEFKDFLITKQFISYIKQNSERATLPNGSVEEKLVWTPQLITDRGEKMINELLKDYEKFNKKNGEF
ncbi:DUF262 domain-containing protein [Mycoplasma sp. VS509_3]|uniref:DUF262 domain-containing protein n=1 Tax=unclassified Mycoplasma TaxID=2683645 RepID=UPI003AAF39F0